MFQQKAWRQAPFRTSARVAVSLLRRRVPSWATAIVPYDAGKSRIHADLTTALGLILFRYGLDDPDIEIVRRLLAPGDVFVDGGANIGLFTLAAASGVGPSGKVIAFEPASSTRELLTRNVALNPFPWVNLRPEALADRPGVLELTVFAGEAAGFSSFRPGKTGGRLENVRTVTLDEIVGDLRPKLVKLDLEGAEVAALLGAQGLLRERQTSFFLEVEPSHLARQGASVEQLCDIFRKAGYELVTPARLPDGSFVAAKGIDNDPGSSPNVLAVPDLTILDRARLRLVNSF